MKTLWKLQPKEFASLKTEGSSIIGTMRNSRTRELYQEFGVRLRGGGANDALFLCWGSVKMMVGDGVRHDPRPAFLPVCLKRAALYTNGDQIKATISDEERWQFNPPFSQCSRARPLLRRKNRRSTLGFHQRPPFSGLGIRSRSLAATGRG